MNTNLAGIKAGRVLLKTVPVNNIQKVAVVIGVKPALKYLSLNFQQYAKFKRKVRAPRPFLIYAGSNIRLNYYKKKQRWLKHTSSAQFSILVSLLSFSSDERRWCCPYDA